MLASEVVTDKALKTTKVFRVEILKPVNYDWKEFYSIINKATYNAAKLANEVMINSFLLSKKYINRDGKSFCSLIISCKECGLGGRVKCAVCREAQLKYSSLAKKILRGDITLPTFRNNSLYIRKEGIHLERNSGGEYSVKLDILPGRDQKQPEVLLRTKEIEIKSPGYLQVLTRILDGGYRLGFTQLIRDKNRKKLYLMMSYTFDNDVNDGWEPGRVMGVDLGVATPAYCAFNDSFERKSFYVEGAKLLSIKREISARRRIIQRGITRRDLRRGHGLQSKFNPLEKRNTKWDNFRRTWNNILSFRIVEYAVNNRAGCIHLEDLSSHLDDLHNLKTCIFIGRDWPVYELLTMIENKAKEKGIKVEKVSPYKTSQTCSRCAVIKENFTFKDRAEKGMPQFECEACGFGKDSKISAHYNAARNIANSTLIIK